MVIDWRKKQDVQQALTALENKEITIQDIIRETVSSSTFWLFLCDVDFFKKLKENNLLHVEDIKEVFKKIETRELFDSFLSLVSDELFDLKLHTDENISLSYGKTLILTRIKDSSILQKEDFRDLFSSIETVGDFNNFSRYFNDFYDLNIDFEKYRDARCLNEVINIPAIFATVVKPLVDKKIVDFKEIVDKCQSTSLLGPINFHIGRYYDQMKYLLTPNNAENFKYLVSKSDSSELYDLFHWNKSCKDYLKDGLISFKEVVDKHRESGRLKYLLKDDIFPSVKFLSKDDLRYLVFNLKDAQDAEVLCGNGTLFPYLLENDIVTFKELLDALKKAEPSLWKSSYDLLASEKQKKNFSEFIRNKTLSTDDLQYLVETLFKGPSTPLTYFCVNPALVIESFDNKLIDFRKLIDKLSTVTGYFAYSRLRGILSNTEGLKHLIEKNMISDDDVLYLLNSIEKQDEIFEIGNYQRFLIQYCTENFLFTTKTLEILDDALDRGPGGALKCFASYCDRDPKILDAISAVQKLLEICKSDCSDKERDKLFKTLHSSTEARTAFLTLVSNNLIDQYNAQELKETLKVGETSQKKHTK